MARAINPPEYFLAFAAIEIVLHMFFPVLLISTAPLNFAGIILIVLGIFLNLWTDKMFRKNGTTVKPFEKPRALLKSGPFSISRNPMYLGMLGILLGEAFLLGTLSPFILPLAFFIIMNASFIPTEEKNLQKAFGKRYIEYSETTRKWI